VPDLEIDNQEGCENEADVWLLQEQTRSNCLLGCDQSNYTSRIIVAHIPPKLLSIS